MLCLSESANSLVTLHTPRSRETFITFGNTSERRCLSFLLLIHSAASFSTWWAGLRATSPSFNSRFGRPSVATFFSVVDICLQQVPSPKIALILRDGLVWATSFTQRSHKCRPSCSGCSGDSLLSAGVLFVFSDAYYSSEDAVSKKWGSVYPQIQHPSAKRNHYRGNLIVRHWRIVSNIK